MRKFTLIVVFTHFFLEVGMPLSMAQNRIDERFFLESLSITQTGTNNFGLGAGFGYQVHNDFLLEGELAYDYGLNFDEAFCRHQQW